MRPIIYGPPEIMNEGHKKFREGIYRHKRNGIYYFSFTNQRNKAYQGFYAMGKSPYGPFDWKGNMASKPDGAQYHHFDKLFYNEDGTIKMVEQTTEKK